MTFMIEFVLMTNLTNFIWTIYKSFGKDYQHLEIFPMNDFFQAEKIFYILFGVNFKWI